MRLGIVGGGQLARMLALAAAPLGVRVTALDPAPDACAGPVADLICAPYDDPAALARLADTCDAVTYEFENLPAGALERVAERVPLRPGVESLRVSQDRLLERELFERCGVPVAAWVHVPDAEAVAVAAREASFPAVLKSRRGGYDGKGQCVVGSAGELGAAWESLGGVPCILEERIAFERELSVVAVRSVDGEVRTWPIGENRHAEGILRTTLAPAPGLDPAVAEQARSIGERVAEELGHVGVLAVELFEVEGGLLANELAPRVHNTGHWTIEGAVTSQFENHVRAVLGLPLGDTALRSPAVMENLIGDLPRAEEVLGLPGAALHLYGKEPRAGRKLGHVTLPAGDDLEAAAERLRVVHGLLR